MADPGAAVQPWVAGANSGSLEICGLEGHTSIVHLMWRVITTQQVLECLDQQVMLNEMQHEVFVRGTRCLLFGLALLVSYIVLLTKLFKAMRRRFH